MEHDVHSSDHPLQTPGQPEGRVKERPNEVHGTRSTVMAALMMFLAACAKASPSEVVPAPQLEETVIHLHEKGSVTFVANADLSETHLIFEQPSLDAASPVVVDSSISVELDARNSALEVSFEQGPTVLAAYEVTVREGESGAKIFTQKGGSGSEISSSEATPIRLKGNDPCPRTGPKEGIDTFDCQGGKDYNDAQVVLGPSAMFEQWFTVQGAPGTSALLVSSMGTIGAGDHRVIISLHETRGDPIYTDVVMLDSYTN